MVEGYNPEMVIIGILLDREHKNHGHIIDSVVDKAESFRDRRAGLAVRTISHIFRKDGTVPAFFDIPEEAKRLDPKLYRSIETDRADNLASFLRECVMFGDLRSNHEYYISALTDSIAKHRLEAIRLSDYSAMSAADEIDVLKTEVENVERGIYTPERKVMIDEYGKKIARILDPGDDPPRGLDIGFPTLDREIGGLLPDDLVIIGARPSVGKTACAVCIVDNILGQNAPCSFYSYDMSEEQFLYRLTSFHSGISVAEIKTREFSMPQKEAWDRLRYAQNKLIESKIYLTFDYLEMPALARSIRDDVKKRGVQAVFIDYLQIVPWGIYPKEYDRVTAVTKAIKRLAREAGVPIVALAQLNRKESRSLREEPRMDELRSSGQIEQDASYILLLHRPPRADGQAEFSSDGVIIMAKAQNGKQGRCAATLGRGFRWEEKFVNYEVSNV